MPGSAHVSGVMVLAMDPLMRMKVRRGCRMVILWRRCGLAARCATQNVFPGRQLMDCGPVSRIIAGVESDGALKGLSVCWRHGDHPSVASVSEDFDDGTISYGNVVG